MPNYQAGKIYSIRSYQTDKIYIGSTTVSLALRLGKHRSKYKAWLTNKGYSSNYSSFEILQYTDHYIELLELYPCSSKSELEHREGQLIRSMDCVNKVVAGRTQVEYYQDNQEAIRQYQTQYRQANIEVIAQRQKRYREANRDQILQYQKQYHKDNKDRELRYRQVNKQRHHQWQKTKVKCDVCNIHFTQSNKVRHIKTQTHKTNFKRAWLECWGEPHTGELTSEDY